jgi:hypothetical protein
MKEFFDKYGQPSYSDKMVIGMIKDVVHESYKHAKEGEEKDSLDDLYKAFEMIKDYLSMKGIM